MKAYHLNDQSLNSDSEDSSGSDSDGGAPASRVFQDANSYIANSREGTAEDDYIQGFLKRSESNPILNTAVNNRSKQNISRAPNLFLDGNLTLNDLYLKSTCFQRMNLGPVPLDFTSYTLNDLRCFGINDWSKLRDFVKRADWIHMMFYLAYKNYVFDRKSDFKFYKKLSNFVTSPFGFEQLSESCKLEVEFDKSFFQTAFKESKPQSPKIDVSKAPSTCTTDNLETLESEKHTTPTNVSKVLQAFLETPGKPMELQTPEIQAEKRPLAPHRIRKQLPDGKVYEFDRYCPHKKADLSNAPINGSVVVCPKHKWAFDLSKGGAICSKSGSDSLHAVCLGSSLNKLHDW